MQRFPGIRPPMRRQASTVWHSRVGSQNLTLGRFRATATILSRCATLWMSPESCQRKWASPERLINVVIASTQRGWVRL